MSNFIDSDWEMDFLTAIREDDVTGNKTFIPGFTDHYCSVYSAWFYCYHYICTVYLVI